tara:strand:- start:506 stop:718 length:213 start_codon:yes stop_codon:yes gene_type:complete
MSSIASHELQDEFALHFDVGLIPLGSGRTDRGRAVLMMRAKSVITPGLDLEARLVNDAEAMRDRIAARGA